MGVTTEQGTTTPLLSFQCVPLRHFAGGTAFSWIDLRDCLAHLMQPSDLVVSATDGWA
jgi:hypothetical protein